jgi:hypothetical protein
MAVRIQFRRGTAAEWASANPTLAAGELGYEVDTAQIKIGTGSDTWNVLAYAAVSASYVDEAIATLVGLSPETLDTLEELAAAIGEDSDFANTVSSNIDNAIADHNALTTNVHGIANTSALVDVSLLETYLDPYATNTRLDEVETSISDHNLETQNVHGISDTANLAYLTDVAFAVTDHDNDVENIHGIANTLELATNSSVASDISDHGLVTENIHGISNTANLVYTSDLDLVTSDLIDHMTSTENVHGIANTAQLVTDSGLTTTLADYATLVDPEFIGTVVLPTTTQFGDISHAELVTLSNVSANIQDQLDSKLATATAESSYARLDGATFTGNVVLTANTSIGTVSSEELGYLNDVTSSIQTQIDSKAPTADPTFTGTVSGVTSSMVGLGNVDNTSDADKPISNAVQTALDAKLALAGGTMTGKITLDGNPTQALHAVTKQYVDSVEAGLLTRPQVKAATTANLDSTYDNGTAGVGATLTATTNGAFPLIDGVALTTVNGNRGLLVKNQTDAAENGRYNLTTQGDAETPWVLTRCSLCDEASEIPGSYTFVTDGDVNGQTGWVQYVDDPSTFTVGTDDIDVFQFAGAGTITGGTNISVNGNEVSVVSNPTFANVITATSGVQFADNTIQTSAGVPSLTSFSEKTASYTLDTLDHQDNVVEMNSASAITFTIPANATLAWPVGASMDIFQMGAGQVTIANAAGVTLNFTPGNKLRTQFSSCTIMKRGTDSWVLYGDLTA